MYGYYLRIPERLITIIDFAQFLILNEKLCFIIIAMNTGDLMKIDKPIAVISIDDGNVDDFRAYQLLKENGYEELWNYDFYKFKEFVEYLSKSDVEVITTKDAFADYR